jgi:DNA (cytosine-5)-methyltransferase 1
MRFWPGFDDLLTKLKRRYHLRIEALDAADFGTPQNRRRLFIIGDKLREPLVPKSTTRVERTARSILSPAGTFAARPVFGEGRARATIARVRRGMPDLGRGHDFLIVYYGSDGAGGWQPLDRPLRTMTTLDRFGLVQWIGGDLCLDERRTARLGRGATPSVGGPAERMACSAWLSLPDLAMCRLPEARRRTARARSS